MGYFEKFAWASAITGLLALATYYAFMPNPVVEPIAAEAPASLAPTSEAYREPAAAVVAGAGQPKVPINETREAYADIKQSPVYKKMDEAQREELMQSLAADDQMRQETQSLESQEPLDESSFGIVAGADDQL